MSSNLEEIKAILKKYGQDHLLNHYESLDEAHKQKLLNEIKNIDLYTEIGTENPILSSFLVTIVNGIFLIILKNLLVKNFKKENVKYKILQSIFCENLLNISLSCIIEWKLVHIMYIFKKIKNRRVKKYGKSSNRRSNEKCYG